MEPHIPGKITESNIKGSLATPYGRGGRRWALGILLTAVAVSGCAPQERVVTQSTTTTSAINEPSPRVVLDQPLTGGKEIYLASSNFKQPNLYLDRHHMPDTAGRYRYYWDFVRVSGNNQAYRTQTSRTFPEVDMQRDFPVAGICTVTDTTLVKPVRDPQGRSQTLQVMNLGFAPIGIIDLDADAVEPFKDACPRGTQFSAEIEQNQ